MRKKQRSLSNDGLCYRVNWVAMKKGSSIFLPCIECDALRQKVIKMASYLAIKIQLKITIEERIRGLRVWRL